MDCSCERCQSLCHTKPGWFTPEQIHVIGRKLNLTIKDLFRKYLTVDPVLIGGARSRTGVYVLAPAIVGNGAGSIADPKARGTCVWFADGKCTIHDVKPRECALVDHSTMPGEANLLRAAIVKQWQPHKKFVQDLYGMKLKLPNVLKEEYRRASGADQGTSRAPNEQD
jgi:hypothetical protein